MTILVTGANGFIGSHVVYTLLKRGYIVRAFVRQSADLRNLDGLDVELAHGDLLKPATLVDAVAGCKAIIHTAGWMNTGPFNSWRTWEINFVGTANVLTAAQMASVEKFVHTASIFSLGVGTHGQPVGENVQDNLGSLQIPYVVARRAADAKAERLLAAGMPIVFVYPTACIGPGAHDMRTSPQRQIIALLRGWRPFYSSGGLNVVDVRDVAEALVLALEHGGVGSKYLAGGENVTFRELFERLGKIANRRMLALPLPHSVALAGGWAVQWFSRKPLMDAATARLMRYHWYYDSSKARQELGYSPRPLDETLRDTVAWLQENRYVR